MRTENSLPDTARVAVFVLFKGTFLSKRHSKSFDLYLNDIYNELPTRVQLLETRFRLDQMMEKTS